MAIKETLYFVLLIVLPVAMMAKQVPAMPEAWDDIDYVEASTPDDYEPTDQTIGKCNGREMKKQIESIKSLLDDLSTKFGSCQDKRQLDDLSKKGCPSGCVAHESSCYYIGKTQFLKWSDARSTCQNMGGDLAIIKSAEENDFIFNLVKNAKLTGYGAWIGLYQKPDTKFYWIDGAPIATRYTAWASGEPNNVYPNAPINCVWMKKLDKGRWNDEFCELPSRFQNNAPVALCQKAAAIYN